MPDRLIVNFKSLAGFDEIKAGALAFCFDAFSSREPVPTSLENALAYCNAFASIFLSAKYFSAPG